MEKNTQESRNVAPSNFAAWFCAGVHTQAVGWNHLFAVPATNTVAAAETRDACKTSFDFEVLRFNENDEIPFFTSDSKRRSRVQYVDGCDAINQEFFVR